jgi:hypothetical protein
MTTNGKNDKKNGLPAKKQHRLLAYFHDDQIMLLVTHDNETISENMLQAVNAEVVPRMLEGATIELSSQRFSFPAVPEGEGRLDELKKLDAALRSRVQNDRLDELKALEDSLRKQDQSKLHPLHQLLLRDDYAPSAYQPQPSTSAFSLLVYNFKKPSDDPRNVLLNVLQLRTALKGKEFQIETVDPQGETKFETLRIEDISPNWAMSVASNGSGTGGPGGVPRPFKGEDKEAPYWFNIREKLRSLFPEKVGDGENVDVAILDTAPCPHALVHAPKQWPDNDLIQGLLGPDGQLSLYSATLDDLRRIDNASLNRHDYEMSDHGLFVAGIVHSIAPKAKIHLIEVLNQWGVGDFLSLAVGLDKALRQIYQPGSGRRLLVNCSWMLDLPLVGDHCAPIDSKDPDYDFRKALEFEEGVLHFTLKERELATAIWAVCNSISLAGGKVIAAAGNDWGLSRKRKEMKGILRSGQGGQTQEPRPNAPEARYPAGFVSAIGVGALPKESRPQGQAKHRASDYSNLGDKPEIQGIMTLGGEEENESQGASQGEGPKKNNGVLGIYLSETYPVEVNHDPAKPKREFTMERRNDKEKNSWGLWAGTSFATPIVTGTIAAVLSSSTQTEDMIQKEIRILVNALYPTVIENAATEAGEDVMEVKQGEEPS